MKNDLSSKVIGFLERPSFILRPQYGYTKKEAYLNLTINLRKSNRFSGYLKENVSKYNLMLAPGNIIVTYKKTGYEFTNQFIE